MSPPRRDQRTLGHHSNRERPAAADADGQAPVTPVGEGSANARPSGAAVGEGRPGGGVPDAVAGARRLPERGGRLGDPGAVRAGRPSSERRDVPCRIAPLRSGRPGAGLRADAGQSSVELIALLPLALLVGLAILTLLAARSASGQAAAAAQAGAMALLQDAEPRAAARAALPPDARPRATIDVRGREVTVTVKPATRVGFLADTLTATASADAGPVPR